jgi:mannose-6-phosphate isomerase-like protein (cupin superfamily)
MIERANSTAFDWPVYGRDDAIGTQWYFRGESEMPVSIQAWTLAPGQAEGSHTHPEERPLEEFYLVVSGQAEATVGGETRTLGPGDAMLAKVGVDHDIRNTGNEALRLIMIWGVPGRIDWTGYRMWQFAESTEAALERPIW